MLGLAATATDGAFPYHVTPERVDWMRGVLDEASGSRAWLGVTLATIIGSDTASVRAAGRAYLAPYLRAPTYQASWAEQGFEPRDWATPGSDRLVDAMIAWGSAEDVRQRHRAFRDAGADHVAIIPLSANGTSERLETLEALAPGG